MNVRKSVINIGLIWFVEKEKYCKAKTTSVTYEKWRDKKWQN